MRDSSEFENKKDPFVKRRVGNRVFNDRKLTPDEAVARGREIRAENKARRNRPKPPLKGQPARRAGRRRRL